MANNSALIQWQNDWSELISTPYNTTERGSDIFYGQIGICIFPTSGQFCLLNRLLFYALLFFGLVVYNHKWLAAGAITAALNYSAIAAAYAVFIAGRKKGDTDTTAVFYILLSSVFFANPLVQWSHTVRQLQVRSVLVFWAMLVFAGAVICAFRNTVETPLPTEIWCKQGNETFAGCLGVSEDKIGVWYNNRFDPVTQPVSNEVGRHPPALIP